MAKRKDNPNPYDEIDKNIHGQSGQNESEEQEQDDENKVPLEKMTQEDANKLFENTVDEQPFKDVELPVVNGEGNDGLPQTMSDTINKISDLTDMQAAQQRLFPPDLGGDIYNHIMVARVDPNTYLARLHLNSVDEIMHSDPTKSIDVNKVWQKHDILLSIGLDGMGRIDDLELAGAAREEKRFESQFKSLGG